MVARCRTAVIEGVAARIVDVEADVSSGLPGLTIVGLADTAVSESRDRVRAAIEHNFLYNGPMRVWTAGPMFRYERPQKGRQRQFHQYDVEALGFEGRVRAERREERHRGRHRRGIRGPTTRRGRPRGDQCGRGDRRDRGDRRRDRRRRDRLGRRVVGDVVIGDMVIGDAVVGDGLGCAHGRHPHGIGRRGGARPEHAAAAELEVRRRVLLHHAERGRRLREVLRRREHLEALRGDRGRHASLARARAVRVEVLVHLCAQARSASELAAKK